jgi:hypothetical protein
MSSSITQETNEFPQTIEGVHLVASSDPCFGFETALRKAREGYKIISKSFSPIYYFKYVESGALDVYTKETRIFVSRLTTVDTKMFAYTDFSIFD